MNCDNLPGRLLFSVEEYALEHKITQDQALAKLIELGIACQANGVTEAVAPELAYLPQQYGHPNLQVAKSMPVMGMFESLKPFWVAMEFVNANRTNRFQPKK